MAQFHVYTVQQEYDLTFNFVYFHQCLNNFLMDFLQTSTIGIIFWKIKIRGKSVMFCLKLNIILNILTVFEHRLPSDLYNRANFYGTIKKMDNKAMSD